MTIKMRRRTAVLTFGVVALVSLVPPRSAIASQTLWYNGDYDLNDAYANQSIVPTNFGGTVTFETALVYDDFVVPVGQSWAVTSLFSNNQLAYGATPTKATWQIRSGMAPGLAGSLLYSGDTAATVAQTHAADGINYIDPEDRISVAVSGITLSAGLYWMAVAPDSIGYYGDQSYIETTGGTNSVGLPTGLDGNSYLNNSFPAPGKLTYALSTLDFSAGVIGTATSVPEPGSLSLAAAAAIGLSRRGRRQRPVGVGFAHL